MSFYVTCIGNKTFVDLNLRRQYEVALVETQFSIDKGLIELYLKAGVHNKKEYHIFTCNLNQFQSIEEINNFFIEAIKKWNIKTSRFPKVQFTIFPKIIAQNKQIKFNSVPEKAYFKLDEKAKKFFKINSNKIEEEIIDIDGFTFNNKSFILLQSDIVKEQIYGNKKLPLLRRIEENNHIIYNYPHYVQVEKTDFDYINIWAVDNTEREINIDNFITKLHFRPKLI